VIWQSFVRALGQFGDRTFRRVVLLGVLLALALLVAVFALFLLGVEGMTRVPLDLPLVGPVDGLGRLLSWGAALLLLALSVFLMVPAAALFSGLFLDTVAAAVEARHYPDLPPLPPLPLGDALVETVNFAALLVVLNLAALFAYPFAGPVAPVLFWALNGWLLGREYFTLAAMRRLGRAGARDLRRRHGLRVWAAGLVMAVPLSLPLVNLFIPVLGAATFTHLFHALARRG
jgi:uncharacterized protein involved in cysteine biosynthesis